MNCFGRLLRLSVSLLAALLLAACSNNWVPLGWNIINKTGIPA
jgi:hypothetical protein